MICGTVNVHGSIGHLQVRPFRVDRGTLPPGRLSPFASDNVQPGRPRAAADSGPREKSVVRSLVTTLVFGALPFAASPAPAQVRVAEAISGVVIDSSELVVPGPVGAQGRHHGGPSAL